MPSLFVVIPTYSELENLRSLIPKLENVFSSGDIDGNILIVDDNSPDGTAEFIRRLEKEKPNIHLLLRPGKMGIGSAYRDGFSYVLKSSDVEYVGQMDADGSHPPDLIPEMIKKLDETGADVVVGSRKIRGGKAEEWPWRRRLTSWGANLLARAMAGVGVKDSTSGYRMFRASALRRIDFASSQAGYSFQVEMIFKCRRSGLMIVEVPFTFVDRRKGRSKLGSREIGGFAWAMVKLFLSRAGGRRAL